VPNVITPYSKDVNATLNIYGANFMDFELTIFNRWGEIIYNTQDHEAPWDGSYRGEGMPIGVYPWIITYDAVCPHYKGSKKLKGDVTVVR
jgi:gliding motility-associated-like protein